MNLKNKKNKVLEELKYYAVAGYSIESIDLNNDRINLIRHYSHTKHPLSLVNFKKNKLNMLSLSTDKDSNAITSKYNTVVAESPFSSEEYIEYITHSSEINNLDCKDITTQLQGINSQNYSEKSQKLMKHFSNVNDDFRVCLRQHLNQFREIMINAELSDNNYLSDEIRQLSNNKQSTKGLQSIEKDKE